MSAASASAAGAAATQSQQNNPFALNTPLGTAMAMQGPGFSTHNMAQWVNQQGNNSGTANTVGTSNVGANAAIAQGDPNNVTAEGFGTNTGATGVGGVSNTYGAPPPMGGIGGFSTMPEVNFSVGTQNAMGGIYGNEQQRQASVNTTDVLNTETLDPTKTTYNNNLRLKRLI